MSSEELKDQVAQFITAIYLRNETSETQSVVLGIYQLLTGSWENADRVVDNIEKITPAEVQAVANKYIHNINFAVVGAYDKIDKSLFESR